MEDEIQRHLDGKREVDALDDNPFIILDLRDAELQIGLNNRMRTGLPNQFYTAGGAGPFDELLERAIALPRTSLNKEVMKAALPVARRMIENQQIIFSNEPGVFSYDVFRRQRSNEVSTPPFVHPPKSDTTELPGEGILVTATGIDGIRESGMYDAVAELGMQLFAPSFSIPSLPEAVRCRVIELAPSKTNNPYVVACYGRAGWSGVWLAQLAEKGFLTPRYDSKDDPEIYFNQKGIKNLGLGAIINDNPRAALEKALELAKGVKEYNQRLSDLNHFQTLDGISYAAEIVADKMDY